MPSRQGASLPSLLLRRAPVPAEGRLRAQPRRAEEAAAQAARDIIRRAGAARHGRGDVAPELRAEAVPCGHEPHPDARSCLREARARAHGRPRHRGGALREARDVGGAPEPRQGRARSGPSGLAQAMGAAVARGPPSRLP